MGHSVFILSDRLVDSKHLIEVISMATKELDLLCTQVSDEHIAINSSDRDNLTDLWMFNEEKYSSSLEDEAFPSLLGFVMLVEFGYDNAILLPFVKRMFESIPYLRVFNEEVVDGSILLDKDYLDNFVGEDAYTCFYTTPEPPPGV